MPSNAYLQSFDIYLYLYGICFDLPSTKAEITLPRADKDKLIFVASFNLSPDAPVLDWRSLPAKSTKFSLPARRCSSPSLSIQYDVEFIIRQAIDIKKIDYLKDPIIFKNR